MTSTTVTSATSTTSKTTTTPTTTSTTATTTTSSLSFFHECISAFLFSASQTTTTTTTTSMQRKQREIGRIYMHISVSSSCIATATLVLPSQCYSYVPNTDGTRSISYGVRSSGCDSASTFGSSPAWVRFSGAAGTVLASSAPSINSCSTDAPGWYTGSYPSAGGTTSGTVCYNWNGNTCNWSNAVSVTNCNGFYVYQLTTPPNCSLRYCTM